MNSKPFLFALFGFALLSSFASAWDNSSFALRLNIPVNVSQGSTPQGYPVLVNLTYQSGMNANFSDVQFYNESGGATLPFWVENQVNSSYANVWVKIPYNITTKAQTIYAYYSCATCTVGYANGQKVFDFFDDFRVAGGFNTTLWLTGGSSPQAGIGEANLSTSGSYFNNKNTFTVNYSMRASVKQDSAAAGDLSFGWGSTSNGISNGLDYVRFNPVSTGVSANSYHTSGTSTAKVVPQGAYYTVEAQRNSIISTIYTVSNGTSITHTGASYVATDPSATGTYSAQLYTGAHVYGGTSSLFHTAWWLVRKFQLPEPAANPFTVETNSNTVTAISTPAATSYVNGTITVQYSYNTTSGTNGTCYRWMDGSRTVDYSVTNATVQTSTYNSLDIGAHNLTVTCDAGGANGTTTALFTRLDWLVQGNSLTTPVFETTNTTLGGGLNTSANVAIQTATLFYNGTNAGVNTSVTTTGTQYNVTRVYTIPLQTVNNSNATFYWSFLLGWSNGTTITVNTTASTQNIQYAYSIGAFQTDTTATSEASAVNATLTVANNSNTATLTVVNYLNASIYGTATQSNTNWTTTLTTPFLGVTSAILYPYGTLNVSFGGLSRLSTSSNTTLNVTQLFLTNCSTYPNYLANFTFKDEENLNAVNATLSITANITSSTRLISHSYNFSFVNATSASLCVSSTGAYYLDTVQDYYSNYATSYPQRSYFIANYSTNTTTPPSISLYLLSNSRATLTQFLMRDTSGTPQANLTVHISRYYPSLNQYLLVAMTKTGAEGIGSTYLRSNDAQFRYYAYDYATLLNSYSPQQVVCDPYATSCDVTLTLTSQPLESYYTQTMEVTQPTPCVYNQSTGNTILSCPYTAPSGALTGITLTVRRQAIWNATFEVCQTTNTAASGSLICNLGTNASVAGNYYTWAITVAHSPPQPLNNGVIDFTSGSTTFSNSQIGIFGMIVLYLALVGVSLYTMSGSIVMAMVALFIGSGLGFFTLSYLGFIFLAIASSILIWKLRQ